MSLWNAEREVIQISCAEDGCVGCGWRHVKGGRVRGYVYGVRVPLGLLRVLVGWHTRRRVHS